MGHNKQAPDPLCTQHAIAQSSTQANGNILSNIIPDQLKQIGESVTTQCISPLPPCPISQPLIASPQFVIGGFYSATQN